MTLHPLMRSMAVACAAVFSVTGALTAQDPSAKPARAGIVNYTRVDATFACGGATQISALPELKKEGFVSVINLRLPSEAGADIEASSAAARELGLKYISIPLNGQAPEASVVDTFLKTVSDKSNLPVFIHCGSASRVGAVWMTKRVLLDGWDVEKARAEALAIGLKSPVLEKFALEYIASHRK